MIIGLLGCLVGGIVGVIDIQGQRGVKSQVRSQWVRERAVFGRKRIGEPGASELSYKLVECFQ